MEPQQRMLGRGGRGVGGEELARQAFGLLSALREACPELRPWPFQRRDRRLLGPPYDASGPAFEENAPAAAARPASSTGAARRNIGAPQCAACAAATFPAPSTWRRLICAPA